LFQWIQESSQITTPEMLHTFNCGVGMIAAAPAKMTDAVVRHLHEQGLKSHWIGEVVSSSKAESDVEWSE
jgi:phosphoribosylformylglycinamidine cyclo-ligase